MKISGKKIRIIRESKNLSRSELSRRAGVSIRTLEDWESGARNPRNIDIIDTVANALGVHISELYTDEYLSLLNHQAMINSDQMQDNNSYEEELLIEKIERIYAEQNLTGILKLLDRFIYETGVNQALKIIEEYLNTANEG